MSAFPLLLFALIFYNLLALGGGMVGGGDVAAWLNQGFSVTMPSAAVWSFTWSDLFVAVSLSLLFLEVVKATRTGRGEILNHALSTLTFVGALVEFLLLPGFATSAFALLTLMTLFDVVAGYTISIVSARRDLMVPTGE